jgi:cytochrome c peroxidase
MTHTHKTLAGWAALLALALTVAGCAKAEQSNMDGDAKSESSTTDSATTPEAAETPAPEEKAVAAGDAPPAPAPTSETSTPDKPKSGRVMLGSDELFAGIPGEGPLSEADLEKWLADPKNHEPLDFELPLGMAAGALQLQGVDKNPLTRAKIELGRQLYFDPRLSADMTISCASCHDPDEGFARHTQFGEGIKGQKGGRNSPVSYNRILSGPQFWDGRAESLEAQAVGPIANPIEMGNTHDACVECLKGIPGYKQQFDKIFGKLDIDSVGQALASFERAIVTGPAPFDYYEQFRPFEKLQPEDLEDNPELKARYEAALAGTKEHPMSDAAKRGRELHFTDKANCSACHVGANLTDEKYHNIGVGMDAQKPDIGREEVTKDPKDKGAFKTPTIRNVALSAPYMHDGSQKTLEEVVAWYA